MDDKYSTLTNQLSEAKTEAKPTEGKGKGQGQGQGQGQSTLAVLQFAKDLSTANGGGSGTFNSPNRRTKDPFLDPMFSIGSSPDSLALSAASSSFISSTVNQTNLANVANKPDLALQLRIVETKLSTLLDTHQSTIQDKASLEENCSANKVEIAELSDRLVEYTEAVDAAKRNFQVGYEGMRVHCLLYTLRCTPLYTTTHHCTPLHTPIHLYTPRIRLYTPRNTWKLNRAKRKDRRL